MVVDARFLKNPHYDPGLRSLSGRDAAAGEYIAADPEFTPFFSRLADLLQPLLPRYLKEGDFTLAVGCTGGRHRSVYVAEKLGAFLRGLGYNVAIVHRDLGE